MNTLIKPRPAKPSFWRKIGIGLGIAVFVLLFIRSLIPCTPIFLKLFVAYPKLEDATVLKGRIEVVGEARLSRRNGWMPPHYYIVNESGRHPFFCGFSGTQHECQSKQWFDGMDATIWFHPWFGTLQYQIHEPANRVPTHLAERLYEGKKQVFESPDVWELYSKNLLLPLFYIGGAAFAYWRYRSKKRRDQSPINSQNPNDPGSI